MKTTIFSVLFLALSVPALAYKEGTYSCKNKGEGLPNNTYRIENVSINGEITGPYVEINRYMRSSANDPIQHVVIKGMATSSTVSTDGKVDSEILSIAAVKLDFDGDSLVNCKAE